MHPIEKIHKMISSGHVLDNRGGWTSRAEALKNKRFLLKHVLNGEVEIGGKWIKLDELKSRQDSVSPNPQESGIGADRSLPILPDAFQHPSEKKFTGSRCDDEKPGSDSFQKPRDHKDSPHADLPPQPKISVGKKPEDTDTFQKETITIRTIPLGNETTLTISESRAGSALVAICSVHGFIDQSNADDFNSQLFSMLDFGVRFFIIDLEHTTLVGSAGWGILAVAARLIKAAHGHLMVCAMSEDLHESFSLLQFEEVIDAQKSITECLGVVSAIIRRQKESGIPDREDTDSFSIYGKSYDDLPLPEKVKTIIAQNGPLSFFRISALLKRERYGKVKINPARLYLLLKELNLETYGKRVRFYRSC